MFRLIAVTMLPLLALIWQTLTETGASPGAGQGSGQSSGSGEGGQTGGAGSSGSGGSAERTSTGQDTSGSSGTDAAWNEAHHDPERAKALIDKLRPYETQAAQLQAQLSEAQTSLQNYEAQNQTELEQATTKVANLEADKALLQQEVRQLKVRVLGGEAGIVDTEAASLLLKWDELGDEPKEETVKAAMAQMVQDRPWLTAQAQTQTQQIVGQSATNAGRTGSGNTETQKPKAGRSRILAGIKAAAKTK
ncbi:MAG: hypothetical protein WKF67_08095 [Rubrobacteraceae bacterium]